MNPQVLIDGLISGSMIGLGAIGLTLVYSILRFPNFAHGELITWGAYFAMSVAALLGGLAAGATAPLGPFSFGWGLIVAAVAAMGLTAVLALVMVGMAGHEALARQESRVGGWMAYGIGTGTLFFVGLLATLYTMIVVIGPEPWYAPQYLLPILGMILGNTLTGVALVMNTIVQAAKRDRAAIEARLALGETRFEATASVVVHAVKTGLMPILNAMAATGVVILPGMMTGQILAGIDPVEAAKYQVMIMFVIAAATALGVMLAAIGGAWLITDSRHRLRVGMLGLV